jgi:hypothetical protein
MRQTRFLAVAAVEIVRAGLRLSCEARPMIRRISVVILGIVLLLGMSLAAHADKRVALVVGNSAY